MFFGTKPTGTSVGLASNAISYDVDLITGAFVLFQIERLFKTFRVCLEKSNPVPCIEFGRREEESHFIPYFPPVWRFGLMQFHCVFKKGRLVTDQ